MGLPVLHNQFFLLGVQFVLLVALVRSDATDGICDTAACDELANTIRSNIDSTADPCDDFYQYACSSWVKSNSVGKDSFGVSKITRRTDELTNILRGFLEEEEASSDSAAVKAAKMHYRACLDEKQLDAEGMTPLVNIVRENGGVWPMAASGDQKSSKTWQEVHDEYARLTGNGSLYEVTVYLFPVIATDFRIVVDQTDSVFLHNLNRSVPAEVSNYVQFIKNLALKFAKASGSTVSEEKALRDARAVVNFGIAIDELRDLDTWRKASELISVAEVQTLINNGSSAGFDLLLGLQRVFSRFGDINITGEEQIHYREIDYLQALSKLVQNTSNDVILNYLHYHYLERHLQYTSKELRTLQPSGTNAGESQNRKAFCAKSPVLQKALAHIYVTRYSNEETVNAARDVLESVRNSYMKQIQRTSYLDSESKATLVLKMKKLFAIIGPTDFYGNTTAVDELYEQYHLGDSYFENIVNYQEAEYQIEISRLRDVVDRSVLRTRSFLRPSVLGLFYQMTANAVVVPTSLLAPPVFNVDWVSLANYAGLGAHFAGAISSAYSRLGLDFGSEGDVSPLISDPSVHNKYKEHMECFAEQYNAYTIKELDDAGLTFDTNESSYFAMLYPPSQALKTSFEAYRVKKAEGGADRRVLNLSGVDVDKQFFLVFANSYCQALNPVKLLQRMDAETYTTSRAKVNGAVSNLPQFSQAFNCPAGSRMNPSVRCSIFD